MDRCLIRLFPPRVSFWTFFHVRSRPNSPRTSTFCEPLTNLLFLYQVPDQGPVMVTYLRFMLDFSSASPSVFSGCPSILQPHYPVSTSWQFPPLLSLPIVDCARLHPSFCLVFQTFLPPIYVSSFLPTPYKVPDHPPPHLHLPQTIPLRALSPFPPRPRSKISPLPLCLSPFTKFNYVYFFCIPPSTHFTGGLDLSEVPPPKFRIAFVPPS